MTGRRLEELEQSPVGRNDGDGTVGEWHRERVRLRQRADSGERFVIFTEQTSRARSSREVLDSLIEHVAEVAGGYRPVIWVEGPKGAAAFMLHSDLGDRDSVTIGSAVPSLGGPVLVTRNDAESSDSLAPLVRLYESTGSTAASLAPLGQGRVLVVLERRSDWTAEPRHWFLLRAMARLAQANLERLEALETIEAREGM